MTGTPRQRFVGIVAGLTIFAVVPAQPALSDSIGSGAGLVPREQGTKGDDLLIGTPGDDDLAGGDGNDVIVGDAYSETDPVSGGGNDKLNGGDGNDIIVGDAFSPAGADGSGSDDISGGPGNDELVGDALVGTYAAAGFGDASGSGNDEINGLLDTDLVVGDAAVHGGGTARCGGSDKLNGETNNTGGPDFAGLGSAIELVVGDCFSSQGNAIGAADDAPIIHGGDGDDVLVGDNFARGEVSGAGSEENMLGGDGNDVVYGDHHPIAAQESGGGRDEPRGGDGTDKLIGGPSKDTCSGGDGRDKFDIKGGDACEETTGAP